MPCRCSTVGTETFTIASGSVTTINGTTLDGVSPAVGDRILVKDAPAASGTGSAFSTQPGNGIYAVTANTTNLSVSRVAELSGTYVPSGETVKVMAGTLHAGGEFTVTTPSSPAAFTYGTGNIQFAKQPTSNIVDGTTGASVSTFEGTTSTSFTDLATTTDTVTVTIGSSGKALVFLHAGLVNNTLNGFAYAGFAMSGANTAAANDAQALFYQAYTASTANGCGTAILLTGLNPGQRLSK